MTETVLILGASGRFGRNAAEAFHTAGWQERRFDRATDDLMTSAQGADVIVNAWNPLYPDWATQVPAQTRQVIAAAKASNATVILPGNVYVYGRGAPPVITAQTPHRAENPLGRIRIEMEAAYRAADIRTIFLRSGDYLDTQPSGNWFDRIIAAKAAKGSLSYPGAMDRPHAWAYLPDIARACVDLADKRAQLAQFEDILFPGYTMTGHDLAKAVNAVLPVRPKRLSWLPIQIAKPFWRLAPHLLEMRYLWDMPHQLDGTHFGKVLLTFRPTPLAEAMRHCLAFQIHPDQSVARTPIKQAV